MFRLLRGAVPGALVDEARATCSQATWEPGAKTATGASAADKHNEQLPPLEEPATTLGKKLLAALGRSETFVAVAFPKAIMPPLFCRYRQGMHYTDHFDVPMMGQHPGRIRTDLAITCFLSDASECEGGELVIDSDGSGHAVKGDRGDVVVYPAGSLHRVNAVTAGERLVAVTWAQSLIRDAEQRAILYDLNRARLQLGNHDAAPLVHRSYYSLLRRWTEL